jgi:hypothetical protein
MSEEDLESLKNKVVERAKGPGDDDYESYGARAFVIGPTYKEGAAHKADRVAHRVCQSLTHRIKLRGEHVPTIWAEFKPYDGEGQSSSSSDDEANTIEVFLDDNGDGTPAIYINAQQQPYSCCPPIQISNQREWNI